MLIILLIYFSREDLRDQNYIQFSRLIKFKKRYADILSAYTTGLEFVYCKNEIDAVKIAFENYFKRNVIKRFVVVRSPFQGKCFFR